MAELGLAASAAGLVSLGIQVSQGLVQYYDTWKDYNEDIKGVYSSIKDLADNFETLNNTLHECKLSRDQKSKVESRISRCNEGITLLKQKLATLRKKDDPKGFRQAIKGEMLRLRYPFQKDTLNKLQGNVQALIGHLTLALKILHVGISARTNTAVARIEGVALDIQTEVRTTSGRVVELLDAKEIARLESAIAWLAAPDPSINHNDARKKHEEGTGEWFIQSKHYQDWFATTGSKLWLNGKAGCCKTIVCSTAIEHVKSQLAVHPDCAIAFFYFTFTDQRKQSYPSMLLSLISQLSRGRPLVSTLQKAHESGGQPSTTVLEKMLVELSQERRRIFLLLDALDESPEHTERTEVMEGLQKLTGSVKGLSVLVTSRPEQDIQDFMREWRAETSIGISRYIIYVEKQLGRSPRLKTLPGATKQAILTKFQEKSGGMFRWAYCQLAELARLKMPTPKFIKSKLEALPKDLGETYERMLTAIDEEYRGLALTALRWLAFSERPLTLTELEEACIIDTTPPPCVDVDNRAPPGSISAVLSSLVLVSVEEDDAEDADYGSSILSYGDNSMEDSSGIGNHMIRLAHFSVKEYLVNERCDGVKAGAAAMFALSVFECQSWLAESCMVYLTFWAEWTEKMKAMEEVGKVFLAGTESRERGNESFIGDGDGEDTSSLLSGLSDFPIELNDRTIQSDGIASTREPAYLAFFLVDYARKYWYVHQRHVEAQSGTASHGVVSFLLSNATRNRLARLARSYNDNGTPEPALHWASGLGLPLSVEALCKSGEPINELEDDFETALHAAVLSNFPDIVKTLIRLGADVNVFNSEVSNGERPLHLACRNGHADIAQLLIQAGADIEARENDDETPLMVAAYYGRAHVVRLLLSSGANVNAQGTAWDCGSALHGAARYGSVEIMQMLFSAGAVLDVSNITWGTPLQFASILGRPDAVKFLVSKGADVNARPIYSRGTALYEAEKGYDPNISLGFEVSYNEIEDFLRSRGGISLPPLGHKEPGSEDTGDEGRAVETEETDENTGGAL